MKAHVLMETTNTHAFALVDSQEQHVRQAPTNVILIHVKTAVPVSTKSTASAVRVLLVSAETLASPTMMTAFQTHAWNGGTCTDGINEFTCICPGGFTEPKCDECDPNPCLNGGICNDEVDGFSCNCPVGYSGHRCEINDNPSGGTVVKMRLVSWLMDS